MSSSNSPFSPDHEVRSDQTNQSKDIVMDVNDNAKEHEEDVHAILEPNIPELQSLDNSKAEKEREFIEIDQKRTKSSAVKPTDAKTDPQKTEKEKYGEFAPSSTFEAVENILTDNLGEIYAQLSPSDQAKFQKKGEETVGIISKMLDSARIKVGKVMSLIRTWLTIIPGVNKFFLEQEVKIKTDKILELQEEIKKDKLHTT